MRLQLHPNTRIAWMIVVATLVVAAGIVAVIQSGTEPVPDNRILFTQHDGNDYEIFMLDGDGLIQLTDNEFDDWSAGWSPDKTRIAFRSVRDGRTSRVYVMDTNGASVRVISPADFYVGDVHNQGPPAWSPDGTRLAYDAFVNGNWDIYIQSVDAEDSPTRVTSALGLDWHPSWSPDGTQIAYSYGDADINSFEIAVIDLNGGQVTQLTHSPHMDVYPQWSPDGNDILFHSERDGDSDIYVMNANGTNPVQLTWNASLDRAARYNAQGMIVFRSERDGDSDIYVMNADGSDLEAVTANDMDDFVPDW